ncbi:MAG: hypothetical protein HW421_3800 [Ignavibacteria bacterium]|nr:hypothetical protein [Ignavibacteria bacterium]
MGSIWIDSRGDLTPFYKYIFQNLKNYYCDWNYYFPRIFLHNFNKESDSSDDQDFSSYKPEEAVLKDIENSEKDKEIENLQNQFDQMYRDNYEEAKYQPLSTIVKAYKNVYGILPNGQPQKEFE